ncbi:MAG: hypothetical protein WBP94_06735, partial [Rhodomicrobiaceae bacterium]
PLSVARDEFGVPPLGVGEQELDVSPPQLAASGRAIGNAQRDGGASKPDAHVLSLLHHKGQGNQADSNGIIQVRAHCLGDVSPRPKIIWHYAARK